MKLTVELLLCFSNLSDELWFVLLSSLYVCRGLVILAKTPELSGHHNGKMKMSLKCTV